jgi:transposase
MTGSKQTKLSDTQLVILSTACQRPDRLLLPMPDRLKGGPGLKVVQSLTAKGLVEEIDAKRGDPVWRETGDGHGVTLIATDAAFAALGIEPEGDAAKGAEPAPAKKKSKARGGGKKPKPAKTPRAPRTDTKQAQLIAMLKRAKGASIEEIAEALGWQHHTVRGAIAGALKKKLGLDVVSEKDERRGRVYRIVG